MRLSQRRPPRPESDVSYSSPHLCPRLHTRTCAACYSRGVFLDRRRASSLSRCRTPRHPPAVALLPLTASHALHLGSGGYGLLLGCVGVGAVAGAALLPGLRRRLTPGQMLGIGSVTVAALALVLAYVHAIALVGIALVIGGTAWILALSTLNSIYQASLPRSRAFSRAVRRLLVGGTPAPARACERARQRQVEADRRDE